MGFIAESYVCDGCGAPKRDVNHWWTILFQNYVLDQTSDKLTETLQADVVLNAEPYSTSQIYAIHTPRTIRGFVILPFTHEFSKLQNARSVCGQQCAHRFVDLYMSEVLEGRDPQASADYIATFNF